jgi:PQQ-dependent catabolism-associated CXXCW motif protein
MRFPSAIVAKGAAIVAAVAILLSSGPAGTADDVPEPEGVWTGPMHGTTPKTLKGAIVLDIAGLDALMAQRALFLDVGPADKKPADFPKDLPWLPIHRTIPGSVWLPGAGAAPLEQAREDVFYARVEELTRGDKSRPVVTFCHPDCWGSWNTAKRLVLKGYTRVHWYPDGIEGWQITHETAAVKPDSVWDAASASGTQP